MRLPMKYPLTFNLLAVAAALVLGGCAIAPTKPSVLVLPGTQKSPPEFQADSAACQQQAQAMLAPEVQAINNQAATSAAVGTVIGAATGALFGYGNGSAVAWGAGTGLAVGSAVGGGNSQNSSYGLQRRFDIAYLQCMYAHGNQVPGQASYRRQVPITPQASRPPPPPPAQPNYPPPNTPPPV